VTERIPKIVYVAAGVLCLRVFFWSLAFIFVDVIPAPVPRVAFAPSFRTMQQGLGGVAASR
jgi:hypothetical protein